MRKLFSLILVILMTLTSLMAQQVSLTFSDVPLSDALRQIDRIQHGRRIVFVLNGLEQYRVNAEIRQMEVAEAVRHICASHPVRVVEQGSNIFVEGVRQTAQPKTDTADTVSDVSHVIYLDPVNVKYRPLHYDVHGYAMVLHIAGLQATDALLYLPNISGDSRRLYVGGNEVRHIYLDGVEIASISELQNLSSEMIESIRVEHQPCALYITLRKPEEGGFYGSLYNSEETRWSSDWNGGEQIGGVWYSRHKAVSLYDKFDFGGYSVTDEQEQQESSSIFMYSVESRLKRRGNHLSNRLSLNYHISESQSLGVSYYVATNRASVGSSMVQGIESESMTLHRVTYEGLNRYTDQELTARYNLRFGQHDSRLDLLGDVYNRSTRSENLSLYGAGLGTEAEQSPSVTLSKVAADVRHPWSEQLSLGYGLHWRYFYSDFNRPQIFNSNFTGSSNLLYRMQSDGTMSEAYVEMNGHRNHYQYNVGIETRLNTVSHLFYDSYRTENTHQLEFCPRMHLLTTLGEDDRHTLSVSYLRQLEDVPYAAMAPMMRWSDALNYSVGNQALRSPVSSIAMVNASLAQGALHIVASYRQMKDEIYWLVSLDRGQSERNGVLYTHPVNLSSTRLFGFQTDWSLHPSVVWRSKVHALWQWRPENEILEDVQYHSCRLYQSYVWSNLWQWRSGWSLRSHLEVRPAYQMYDRSYRSTYSFGGEMCKYWLNNRLQCALQLQALGRQRNLLRQVSGFKVNTRVTTPVQSVGLRVVWHFSGGHSVNVDAVEGGQTYQEADE